MDHPEEVVWGVSRVMCSVWYVYIYAMHSLSQISGCYLISVLLVSD